MITLRTSSTVMALLLGLMTAGISCSDAPPPRESLVPLFEAGAPPLNDAGQALGCPDRAPKPGEFCPRGFSNEQTCTFSAGTCTRRGVEYEDSERYCCPRGFWERCGGGTEACLTPEDPLPTVDAAAVDAPVADAPAADAGVDASGLDAASLDAGENDASDLDGGNADGIDADGIDAI